MATVTQIGELCLADVYETNNYLEILYGLLSEREAYESISHEEMPTFFQHGVFVASHPYRQWWFIINPDDPDWTDPIGTIALTRQNEIAISIAKKYRRMGWATKAIKGLMTLYPHIDFLANINPANKKSIALFSKFGFKHVQNTYKIRRLA